MGLMTTVTILNDGFEAIKNNPEQFLKGLEDGMYGMGKKWAASSPTSLITYHAVGSYDNCFEVALSQHSNQHRLYLVGGNCMQMIEPYTGGSIETRKRNLEIAKRIIEAEENALNKLMEEEKGR